MKRYLYGIALLASILFSSCAQSNYIGSSYTDEPSISYQQFYDDLSPYGQWVNNPHYGYVWAPRAAGFRPYYTNGHWTYTNYGWTWVSDYNWGWATFHYGRWFYDNFYGWMWVPGYEWAPAWVSWRQNSNYYGWAPLCPQRRNGSYYQLQADQWAFVPNRYITSNNLNNYYVSNQSNINIINNTTIINNTNNINNTSYHEGPSVADVEKITNAKIRTFQVKQIATPGNTKLQDGVLKIYKPVVKENTITARAGENTPGATKTVLLPNQPAATGQTPRTVQINNGSKRLPVTSPDMGSRKPSKITENITGNEQPQPNADINPAAAGNANKAIDAERRIRELRNRQQQDIERQPVNTTPGTNIQRPEGNGNVNTAPPRRVLVSPPANQVNVNQQQERQFNNQAPNPAVNQQPSRSFPSRPVERPAGSFERRIQTVPQNAPAINNGNTGIRKLKNIQ